MSETFAVQPRRRGYSLSRAMFTVAVAIGMSTVMVAGADARTNNPRGLAVPSSAAPSTATPYMYFPLTPNRILDTRANVGLSGPLHSRVARTFTVTNRVPGDATKNVPTGAIGVTGNLTVDHQTFAGYFSLTLSPANNPTTSTLNFPGGNDDRANSVTNSRAIA